MNHLPKHWSDERDWRRIWRDAPSFSGCCCGGDTYMYAFGGADTFLSTDYTTCDKIAFAALTGSAVAGGVLSLSRYSLGAAANPTVAGYMCGGATTSSADSVVVTADKFDIASQTTSATSSANLSQARQQLTGLSERSTKAYYCGGGTTTPLTEVVTTDKLTFSGDSTSAASSADLTAARKYPIGITEGSSKGYVAGGFTGSIVTGTQVTAWKLTFSGDSISATSSANLSSARALSSGGSDGSTKGYFVGGQTGALSNKVDKITFSTDTTAAVTSTSFDRYGAAHGSNGTVMLGVGGSSNVASITQNYHGMTFSTDTSFTATTLVLSVSRQLLAGFSEAAL